MIFENCPSNLENQGKDFREHNRENLSLMGTQPMIRFGHRKGVKWIMEKWGSELSHYAFSYSIVLQLILGVVCCLIHYSI